MLCRISVLMLTFTLANICILYSVCVSAQGATDLLKITKPTPRIISKGSSVRATIPSTLQATSSSTTEANPATSVVPEICIHGVKIYSTEKHETHNIQFEREFVQVREGDAMLSILTTDVASPLFVTDRINRANLLDADFEIGKGVRAILIENESVAENLLMQEVQYLQQCIAHAIGIFVDYDLYKNSEQFIKDLEYNIWPILPPRMYVLPKVAHLLHQMPWAGSIASVEIVTENLDTYNEFIEAVRHEHMCLMHFKSDNNIYILFGNKLTRHFEDNSTIFAITTDRTDRTFLTDLPDKSYILMESEVDPDKIEENSTMPATEETLRDNLIQPSRVFAFARPMLEIVRWLKGSLMRNCKREQNIFVLESCLNFLNFIGDWQTPENRQYYEPVKLLELLDMQRFTSFMNFKMFQKRNKNPNERATTSQDNADLQEIASQNFITNITTFYHYNQANSSSMELKPKFGQVFNCQYSAGENRRYPFLFDGESVMFWRIKPDAWVATGMTAAILGLIITLAILVFIVVRISLGDVFEGNPVTSILLLLSMILLFTSFVPFSLEYIGEHKNSHVTFEDAATLNTLCAVRVFIMTFAYCLTFSLLLCRAVMLASIGSEGGFLSHVNGYIQAVICIFSVLVQLGMSVQLLVIMHVATESISCENMYYGHWLWVLVGYDFMLLMGIVGLVPFIYRSQRNYREGILIVIGAVLTFAIWIVWIGMSLLGDEMRDAAISLGLQATGWAILIGVLIPRTFLIVRGIERSDIAQALPSLTSLAFAQNNQYSSEQSVYECVNPAMRSCSQVDIAQSPSEIPTLPLRGGAPRRQQFFANLRQANANINPQRQPPRPQRGSPTRSECSSLPGSPESSKITRF